MQLQWHEGDVLRKLRDSVNWTLDDLSQASGVSPSVINRIEKGRTREAKRRTLDALAAAFGFTCRQLQNAMPEQSVIPLVVRKVSVRTAQRRRAAREKAVAPAPSRPRKRARGA